MTRVHTQPEAPSYHPVTQLIRRPEQSNARRARRPLVLLQARQQLAEALLARARPAALGALAAQVDQLGDALPAGAAGARVLARGQEGVGLAPRLRDRLLLLGVVVLVEVVDGLLRRLDRLLLLGRGGVGPVLQGEVPPFAPLPGEESSVKERDSGRDGRPHLITSGSSSGAW